MATKYPRSWTRMPYFHLEHTGINCLGCGRTDPMGVHYKDCALLDGSEIKTIKRGPKWWIAEGLTESEAVKGAP